MMKNAHIDVISHKTRVPKGDCLHACRQPTQAGILHLVREGVRFQKARREGGMAATACTHTCICKHASMQARRYTVCMFANPREEKPVLEEAMRGEGRAGSRTRKKSSPELSKRAGVR